MDDIDFPDVSHEIKQEAEEFELPTNCLEVNMDIGEKSSEQTFLCKERNKSFKDKHKLKKHEKSQGI